MPTANCGYGGRGDLTGQRSLVIYGPSLLVEIGFDPTYRRGSLERPDLPNDLLPALVDTGALESCIDDSLAEEIGLPAVEVGSIAGVGGIIEANIYIAQMYVPGLHSTVYGRFAGAQLQASGLPYYALIGRTFLQDFTMVYDGPTGTVALSDD